MSSLTQCLLTIVRPFSLNAIKKWIVMMYILNNVTKQPPDHIKNIIVEIRLKIDAWIIPTPYIVALDCIFTIVVESALKIGAECIYMCTNSPNYQIWLV